MPRDIYGSLYNYFNLTKKYTCFKGLGPCIDLIHTNRKYCFQGTSSFKTGFIYRHHLIYCTIESTFEKKEPKQVIYPNYKQLHPEYFENDFKSSLINCNGNISKYQRNLHQCTVNLHIQSEYRKIRSRKNSVFGHFSRN